MSEIFYSLEQELSQYINSIHKKIGNLYNQSNGKNWKLWKKKIIKIEKKEAAISEAEYELKEVEKCVILF